MAKQPARNTKDSRICRECNGAGELIFNDSWCRDPQQEYAVKCAECSGDGWIRTAPIDPICLLAKARNDFRKFGRYPHVAMRYGSLRQTVVSPAPLPDDLFAIERRQLFGEAA